jgi:poly-gamma-glutamate synthase PgsB/CapB
MIGTLIMIIILVIISLRLIRFRQAHEQRVEQIRIRIHVNGIRGKSTVTRLIAGVLREAGYNAFAKTTGSAARIIHPDGLEVPIPRFGAPTITEQIRIMEENTAPDTEAMVMECMAVNPLYQKITQEQIVKGNITIITNVREDHQDLMGDTLPEIADSLSNTIPQGGLLITAEDRPHLRAQLEHNAHARGSSFLFADAAWVNDEDLRRFNYLSFKENLAIGLAVAEVLGIPRDVAMRGMSKALPDIGAVFIKRTQIQNKEIVWAPLFAVNDRESTIIGIDALRPYHRPDATRIGILNNRYDRAVRALQFAEIAATDLHLDYYLTFGAYERQVTDRMVELGFPRERIINLGDTRQPTLDDILGTIARVVEGGQGLLIGLVNIHTPQAELLLHHFEDIGREEETSHLITQLEAMPTRMQRQRYVTGTLIKASAGRRAS